jgi:flagellar M-ring protein FliF
VESARVHLAIPKPSVFIRDKQAPSASVLVNLHPGRVLDAGQVQSIVHLVSSSVPELSPKSVTVVDQAGNLMTARSDASAIQGLDAGQLDYVRQMESYFSQRIEAIVSPIVGPGNVKAEVRADLDFSQSEATSETYKPNPTPETQAIRSQQTMEDSSGAGSQAAQGVPGALTNQPPGPATAPPTAPAGANAGPNVATGVGQAVAGGSHRKESTLNFELDKTIRHVKDPVGRVKRLSVAVVVNYRAAIAGPEGEPGKPTPLTAQELEQINNLVKEAMGFSQERGDTVNVVNAAFTEIKTEMEMPIWKDPDNVSMAKSLLKNLIVFGLAFYLVFGVLRPLLRDLLQSSGAMAPAGPGVAGAEGGAGEVEGGAGLPRRKREDTYAASLSKAQEFAKANPQLTADIIKQWMAKE